MAMNPSFLGVFAHLGCAGTLQREGLLQNLCGLSGASAGAQCGAFIASGGKVFDVASEPSSLVLHQDMNFISSMAERRWQVLDPSLGPGLLHGQGLEDEMASFLAPTFEDLSIPFACTAWSAWAFRTEVLRTGPLPRAVRASCTVPGLFHPTTHARRRWLLDGGLWDPSGSVGLSVLPRQPRRSLHVVVNRKVLLGLDARWTRPRGPSDFGVARTEVVTVRLNRPPALFLGEASFKAAPDAVSCTAQAVHEALDRPLVKGSEEGHWVLDVDVAWRTRQATPTSRL